MLLKTRRRVKEEETRVDKTLQFSDDYFLVGFTSTSFNPPFCGDRLANSSVKPAHLERHLNTKHANHAGEAPELFLREYILNSAHLKTRCVKS